MLAKVEIMVRLFSIHQKKYSRYYRKQKNL